MSADMHRTILTISKDEMLQHSRTLLLESAGYRVVALQPKDIRSFLGDGSQPNPALVLLCHSLSEADKQKISVVVKQKHPNLRVMAMYNVEGDTATYVDRRITNMHSPQHLLNSIEELVGGD
ncbi:MAG TPA: hypothetical protein VM056_07565 [Terriglobales bacterium]|nr:hypothetical protein [Terriglobales bacterium]